jgi:hypothetical protein
LKEKYIFNTNPFVKQVDSIAATGTCIFSGVLPRDFCGSCHAVKLEIQKYVTLCSIFGWRGIFKIEGIMFICSGI